MAQNLLVLCGPAGAAAEIGALAQRSGATLGLVNTRVDPSELRVSGKRIEELRDYGGISFHAFDEPLCVGSAIAQLAGYADAVVVDRLDDWAARLQRFHEGESERIASELTSVSSVLAARLADVLLVSAPQSQAESEEAELHRRMLDELRPHFTRVIDLTRG
jgi:hypothetical protein